MMDRDLTVGEQAMVTAQLDQAGAVLRDAEALLVEMRKLEEEN